ncbi:lysozyme, N-acetylmuramoyl-L-alanine amidase [Pectobacterium phage PP47]|uniref:Lysozyme, N-acetylmuramoyl-L-alanine amidase n=1 Tax=Pectobacterium phage PP47 TaxID=1932882 RepID=A0A1P8L672_9CAUD|nr:amidase [Pectobacterium phage PP47]APW79760.1 lysozyme, N-acetylmuramoyl-L-alanine amidase [Pectobacterium phage PP47]
MAKVQFKTRKETRNVIIHCAATKPSMNIGVREIRQWHKERGFLDVGYHFVIKRDGTIEEGRDIDQVGAHTVGQNDTSVGICLVGGINDKGAPEANFTPIQMSVLRGLLEKLKGRYPQASVKGHYDFAAKACPSFKVPLWLEQNVMVTNK